MNLKERSWRTPLSGPKRAVVALLMTILLSLLFSAAAKADENDALFRYGSLSCDEWVGHSSLTEAEAPKWFLSFLAQQIQATGYRVDLMDQIKSVQIMPWIDAYCRAHPLDGLAVAGAVLTNELAERAAPAK
jgi:hypothetical protein